ncbi:phylloplanin-like [Corylus avellana]|uniref:phylloplanin-like n=1 Tax=Corylus avellana TaxID=13451 RepID=UPI00286B00FC|nr:phylloplanin-like [Corylus avellana]
MATKLALFVFLVIAAVTAPLPRAQSQLGGLLGLIRINGTVFCSINGNIGANGAVFPNAQVQLRCGAGNVVSTTTTNGSGVFSMLLDPLQFILSSLMTDCNLVVATPLSTCNANLPNLGGALQSPLQLVGTIVSGLFHVTTLIPTGFLFTPAT